MKEGRREQAEAVQRMQDHIEAHMAEPITLKDLADAAGYSLWHASRLFQQLVGTQPLNYVRSRRMTKAAQALRNESSGVMETALRSGFGSHEGFTRAFGREFGLTPSRYAKDQPPVPWFMARSALHLHQSRAGSSKMPLESQKSDAVFVRLAEGPARKLLIVRAKTATEYWTYCEEVGCDVWGLLASLPGALDEPKGFWLPDCLRPAGTSQYVMGVEFPMDWSGTLIESGEVIELPVSQCLVFQGQPYPDAKMGEAIGALRSSMMAFDPAPLGMEWAEDELPSWQMAPLAERGVIEGRPVRKMG